MNFWPHATQPAATRPLGPAPTLVSGSPSAEAAAPVGPTLDPGAEARLQRLFRRAGPEGDEHPLLAVLRAHLAGRGAGAADD
jgi:hypothetical protein